MRLNNEQVASKPLGCLTGAMSNKTETLAFPHQVPPSSPILRQVANVVPLQNITAPETQEIIDIMFEVAHGAQGDASRPTLVGLAAPQIGIAKRIVIIGINAVGAGEQPELKVFINPEIIDISEEQEEGREGCFSTSRVCGIVNRAVRVTVKAYDRKGRTFTWKFKGFPARVAQHEVDHLNGIRFPDRITDDSKLHWVEEDEFGVYREQWRGWTKLCPRTRWNEIKLPILT